MGRSSGSNTPLTGIHFTAMALPMGKAAAMKAMKAKKTTMKAMKKVMKAKRVSVIAKGKNARAVVFRGSKAKTATGMTKDKLMKNKNGKIDSSFLRWPNHSELQQYNLDHHRKGLTHFLFNRREQSSFMLMSI